MPLIPDQARHSQAVEVGALERTPGSGATLADLSRVLSLGTVDRPQRPILTVAGGHLVEQLAPDLLKLSLVGGVERRAVPADEGHADDHLRCLGEASGILRYQGDRRARGGPATALPLMSDDLEAMHGRAAIQPMMRRLDGYARGLGPDEATTRQIVGKVVADMTVHTGEERRGALAHDCDMSDEADTLLRYSPRCGPHPHKTIS
jgi:hypothetical protein